jgi:hypothetical protein
LPSIVLQTTSQNTIVISDKPSRGIISISGVSKDDQRFVAFSTRSEGPNLYSVRAGIFNPPKSTHRPTLPPHAQIIEVKE